MKKPQKITILTLNVKFKLTIKEIFRGYFYFAEAFTIAVRLEEF